VPARPRRARRVPPAPSHAVYRYVGEDGKRGRVLSLHATIGQAFEACDLASGAYIGEGSESRDARVSLRTVRAYVPGSVVGDVVELPRLY